MAIDLITYTVLKNYIDETLKGEGALVGKNVQISKIEPIENGNRVTFSYTLDDGTLSSSTMDVMNGEQGTSITNVIVDSDNMLKIILSDGSTIEAGKITANSDNLKLDNYYTKIETENLVNEKLNKTLIFATSNDIKNMFAT